MKKVMLGIPVYKTVSSLAYKDHMEQVAGLVSMGVVNRLKIVPDRYLPLARNEICATAVDLWEKEIITHLLFMDDDMLIPKWGVQTLLNRNLPVVGGLCFTRELTPIAYTLYPHYRPVPAFPSKGTWGVDVACTGCLLIECSILKDMEIKYGDKWWFQDPFEITEDNKKGHVGEDIFFFKRLKEMNVPVYIDSDVPCDHSGIGVANLSAYKLLNPQVAEATGMMENAIRGDIGVS